MFTKNYTVLVILPVLLRMDKGIEPFSLAAPCLRIWNKFPIGCNCFHKDKDKKIKKNVYICVIQKKESNMKFDFPQVDLPCEILAWNDVTEDILNIYKQSCRLESRHLCYLYGRQDDRNH